MSVSDHRNIKRIPVLSKAVFECSIFMQDDNGVHIYWGSLVSVLVLQVK